MRPSVFRFYWTFNQEAKRNLNRHYSSRRRKESSGRNQGEILGRKVERQFGKRSKREEIYEGDSSFKATKQKDQNEAVNLVDDLWKMISNQAVKNNNVDTEDNQAGSKE